jgi:hypothetical protein
MQAIDIAQPDPGTSMRERGEIVGGRRPELEEMLALQIALRALARDGRPARRDARATSFCVGHKELVPTENVVRACHH